MRVVFALAGLFCAANPALAATYDCTVESPIAVHREGETATLKKITVGGAETEKWNFTIEVKPARSANDLPEAVITWPTNPIQIQGTFIYLPTSDASGAIVALSGGPCLFTESACMTIIQIVDQSDKVAKVEILPSAIAGDEKSGREPFLVVMEGECAKGAAT